MTFENSRNLTYKAHYCLAINFQEAFSNKIIWVSASLFRLAEDGQQVLSFLKEYNEDTSITVLAIINVFIHHLMLYLGFFFFFACLELWSEQYFLRKSFKILEKYCKYMSLLI